MTTRTDQQLAANCMGAVAHLLGGRPGLNAEFIDKVELILSAHEPHALNLMQFCDRVRRTGRPTIWMHLAEGHENIPSIGLVARSGGQAIAFEQCWLWSTPNGKVTHLIPDNFKMGSFVFDADLRLRHLPKPPMRNYDTAQKGMIRAYLALCRIETEQLARNAEFRLPQLATAA